MSTSRPFALRLFVPSGQPEGMGIVEKTNWSGIGFVVPRSQLREFWTTAFAFTSQDGYLNKDHAQHLEARLFHLAQQAKRCRLENAVQDRSITLAEMDRAEADGFLAEVLLCCPVLGFRAFEQPTGKPAQSSRRLFHLKGPDASGQGFESPGGFTVLRGARAP